MDPVKVNETAHLNSRHILEGRIGMDLIVHIGIRPAFFKPFPAFHGYYRLNHIQVALMGAWVMILWGSHLGLM